MTELVLSEVVTDEAVEGEHEVALVKTAGGKPGVWLFDSTENVIYFELDKVVHVALLDETSKGSVLGDSWPAEAVVTSGSLSCLSWVPALGGGGEHLGSPNLSLICLRDELGIPLRKDALISLFVFSDTLSSFDEEGCSLLPRGRRLWIWLPQCGRLGFKGFQPSPKQV